MPQISPDGRYLYYTRGWPFSQSVWRIPVEGGEETRVIESVHQLALYTVRQEAICFFTTPDDKGLSELCLYEYASGKTRKIMKMERPVDGGPSLSPDGRRVLFSQVDESSSDLMLVENFR